jgi:hypothetical protein
MVARGTVLNAEHFSVLFLNATGAATVEKGITVVLEGGSLFSKPNAVVKCGSVGVQRRRHKHNNEKRGN